MTKKLRAILDQMEQSGQSEQLAVSECLTTIAENGDGSEQDSHLLGCAEEIRDAAQSVIDQMSKRPKPIKLKHFVTTGAVVSYVTGELLATMRDDLDRMQNSERQHYTDQDRQDKKDKIRDVEAIEDFLVVAAPIAGPTLEQTVKAFMARLPEMEDPDTDMNGGDAVEVLGEFWPKFKRALEGVKP